jgi:3-methyladenine DNA glycosylase AlkD
MTDLEAAGTAQNRKVYARHGVKAPCFGVSFANLRKLASKIKTDHALAQDLWATGNHDARVLATMIADPAATDAKQIDAWAKDLDNYVLTDAFSGFVGRTRWVHTKAASWAKSKSDHLGQLGWNLVAGMAMFGEDDDDTFFRARLETIESEIHSRKNRTRHAMNMALCAIGIGREGLRDEAIKTAKRIGKVEVDHGQTGCKTPDAVAYIQRAARRKKK